MNLTRRSLLATASASAAAAAIPGGAAIADSSIGAKHLIVVLAYGGWDTTYALDPKPGLSSIDAPAGDITHFGDIPIFTHADRPSVDGFFNKYGSTAAVINGLQMRSLVHTDCTKRLLTGTASDANPDMGSIISYELGLDLPSPYLVLGPTAYTGPLASISTRAGTVNQIRVLLSDAARLPPADPTIGPRFSPNKKETSLIRGYVEARAKREQAIRGMTGANQRKFDDFMSSLERSDVVRDFSSGFGDDFTFTLDIREQVTLGLDAIDRGVCHCLHLEQAFATWDTHAGNAAQAPMHEDLFNALTFLGDELASRDLLDNTVVAVVSEMGRTPKLNGADGKDHWPVTSALVFGAGVKHGVYGKSTDELNAESIDLATGEADEDGTQLQYGNLAAGLIKLCGVDPAGYLPNSEPFNAIIG